MSEESDNTVEDDYRIDYLRKQIKQAQLAITDGANCLDFVRGVQLI
ncbi:family 1 glycosylhydrolase [Lacrimispora sp. JR3]